MPEYDPAKETPFLRLYKPDHAEAGWGPALNTNFDKLDHMLQHHDYLLDGVNIIKLAGNPIGVGKGVSTNGTMRVVNADDDPLLVKIEDNTKKTATNVQTVATVLSDTLNVRVKNNENDTIGINERPIIVNVAEGIDGKRVPIPVYLQSESGVDLDLDFGVVSEQTLRVTMGSDDPVSEKLISLDEGTTKSYTPVTLPNSLPANLVNTLSRDSTGRILGTPSNPPSFTLAQDGANIKFAFGTGNVNVNTPRVTFATDDINLVSANARLKVMSDRAGWSILKPGTSLSEAGFQMGMNCPGGFKLATGDIDANLHVKVRGGVINSVLKTSLDVETGVDAHPLIVNIKNAGFDPILISIRDRIETCTLPVRNMVGSVAYPGGTSLGFGWQTALRTYSGVQLPLTGDEQGNLFVVNNAPTNVDKWNGQVVATGRGAITPGTLRVAIADDDSNLSSINYIADQSYDTLQAILDKLTNILNANKKPFNEWTTWYMQHTGTGVTNIHGSVSSTVLTRRQYPMNSANASNPYALSDGIGLYLYTDELTSDNGIQFDSTCMGRLKLTFDAPSNNGSVSYISISFGHCDSSFGGFVKLLDGYTHSGNIFSEVMGEGEVAVVETFSLVGAPVSIPSGRRLVLGITFGISGTVHMIASPGTNKTMFEYQSLP